MPQAKIELRVGSASGDVMRVAHVLGLDTSDPAEVQIDSPSLSNPSAMLISTYPNRADLAGRVIVTVPDSVLLPKDGANVAEIDAACLCDALYRLLPEIYKRVLCDNMLANNSALTPASTPTV